MKVILYMAISADGLIAGEKDETPWSNATWESYYNFVKDRKNIVLGRRTYELMQEVNEFEKIGRPFTVVVSNDLKRETDKNFAFADSPRQALEILEQKGFKEALVAGGGHLNGSFMAENLVDEIYLDVEPVVLGKGIRLFENGNLDVKLELLETKKLSENEIQLHYQVLKKSLPSA